jgi:hypothetical protein
MAIVPDWITSEDASRALFLVRGALIAAFKDAFFASEAGVFEVTSHSLGDVRIEFGLEPAPDCTGDQKPTLLLTDSAGVERKVKATFRAHCPMQAGENVTTRSTHFTRFPFFAHEMSFL